MEDDIAGRILAKCLGKSIDTEKILKPKKSKHKKEREEKEEDEEEDK